MELEELKNTWVALDNRLKKNEALTETLIITMTENKVKKSVGRLLFLEVYGAVGCFIALLICVYAYYKIAGQFPFIDIKMIFFMITCFIAFIWQIYKVYGLIKIDFSKKISNNIYNINIYNILIKREKSVSMVGLPIVILLIIITYVEANVGIYIWIFLFCITILALFVTCWLYKKFYKKNINSILESLNEIRDLEEKD